MRNFETPLIIDEFHYAPNLLNYIKIKVDEARKNAMFGDKKEVGTMYYLTGSQIFETMCDVSKSLTGRVGILDLYVFSTREIYDKKDILFVPDIDLIKESANPGFNPIKNFDVVKDFGYECKNGIVLCMMQNIIAIDNNNYYVPIEYI